MSLDEIIDNAGQMPEPGVTVITVIPLRLGVSVDNRWITVVRSVRSNNKVDGNLMARGRREGPL